MHPHCLEFIRRWLLLCCGMIYAMAVIGAITRLTESGLSIVEWNPVTGALPPLSETAWQKAFTAYQQIPQYKLLNNGMSLEAFKQIYFWEWLHRLWGRLIGLVYALPFFWLLLRRQIPTAMVGKLWVGLLLGGLQGAVGWFMVASGLQELVYVSHLRLALHLALALLIYSYLLWLALGIHTTKNAAPSRLSVHGIIALFCLSLTIIWGAFVAGLKAGWIYNSFPLMDGEILPEAAWSLQPLWHNIFANPALVQFSHRWLAVTAGIVVLLWCWQLRKQQPQRPLIALAALVGVQIALGIATLLNHAPILLGALHQTGAIMLLTLLIYNLHCLRHKPIV